MKHLIFLCYLSAIVFFLVGCYFLWERTDRTHLTFSKFPTRNSDINEKVSPSWIKINSLKISLPILPAKISQGAWETTKEGVSYLTLSPIPGHVGNSIIYGHNYGNLLGNLVNIKSGDEIQIGYSDRTTRSFEVAYTQTVTPDQTHVLSNTSDIRLTIYTCTGFLDLKRFVVTAVLKEGQNKKNS